MRCFEKISYDQFKNDLNLDEKTYNSYELPTRSTQKSAGYDFKSIIDFEIKPGEIKKIPTGIKANMNDGEVLILVVRSSMGFKYNIRLCNQVGVIDADYYNNEKNEGHIYVALQNEGNEVYKVKSGESFCQGLFINYLTVDNEKMVDNKRTGWSYLEKEDRR